MSDFAVPEGAFITTPAGVRVHYHTWGEGPAVLFLHGSGPGASGWSNFADNARYLAERGLRAIVPDLPGYGLSDKPEHTAYEFPFLAESVMALMDALAIELFAVVGNSMGGALSIYLALEHPGRVERLLLMAPGGLESRHTYMQMRGIRTMLAAVFDPGGLSLDAMHRIFKLQVFDPKNFDPSVIERRYAVAKTQPLQVFKTLRVPNLVSRLGDLKCPVFGLWGLNDNFCPVSGADTLARGCPDARVMTLSSCGHWVMVEKAALFNRLSADFLLNG